MENEKINTETSFSCSQANIKTTESTNITSGKKVVAWFRVSTTNQDTEMQKRAVYDAIYQDKYTDADIITIEGVGASAIKVDALYKQKMNQLFDLMESGTVCRVYAWALDRLGRDDKELTYLRWKLDETGVELRTLDGVTIDNSTDNDDTKMMQKFMMTFKSLIAADEMRKKQKRMSEGRVLRKAEGFLTHEAKFGWDKVKVGRRYKAVVNEEQAALIRRVYKMYLVGMPANAIGRQLRDEGIINRKGKRGNCCFVWKILNDTDYTGSVEYPAIVSREEYEHAQERLRSSHTEVRYQYDDGLIWYGKHILYHNGLKMHITNRDGAYKSADDKGTLNINVVDSLLLWLADKYQREFEVDKDEMKDVLRQRIATYRKQLEIIEAEREDIQKRIRKANNQYDADALTDEQYKDKIGIINAKKRELGDRERHTLTMIDDTENEIKNREQPKKWVDIYSLSDVRRAEIIRMVVNRIDVERGSKQGTYFFHIKLATGTRIEIFSETMKHKYYMNTNIDIVNSDTKAREEGFVSEVATDENGDRFFVAGYTPHRVGDEIKVPWVVRLDSKTKRLRQKKMAQYMN